MDGALSGIKIVEAASYVTGPFASQLLADMGCRGRQDRRAETGGPVSRMGREELCRDILQSEPE